MLKCTYRLYLSPFQGLELDDFFIRRALPYVAVLNPFRVESTPKSNKIKIATKTPSHQISQNKEYQQNYFGGILCFSALVAKKDLSEWTQILKMKSE